MGRLVRPLRAGRRAEQDRAPKEDLTVLEEALEQAWEVASRELFSGEVPEGEAEGPVLPLLDNVLFPRTMAPVILSRPLAQEAALAAQREAGWVLLVAQREAEVERPGPQDLFNVGTLASLGPLFRLPDGEAGLLVQGRARIQILEWTQTEPYLRARFRVLQEVRVEPSPTLEALRRSVRDLIGRLADLNPDLFEDEELAVLNLNDPGRIADYLAGHLQSLNLRQRQALLEALDPLERLQEIHRHLVQEVELQELQARIQDQAREEMIRGQREIFLREQIRALQAELGEQDPFQAELEGLRERIARAHLPAQVRARAEEEVDRLAHLHPLSPEAGVIRTYLDWILALPWQRTRRERLDVAKAAQILDRYHYGLEKVKERILEFIAVRKLAGARARSPILCFVGPPGTGKTSMGRAIAEALNREFLRVSLGGVRDEAEIRGHRRTYIGALPGRILQTMRNARTINPLFMLDEIDKLGLDFRGDPAAALLEVLDPEQNKAFLDHYLDLPYDLSRVLFITTANYLDPIPEALLDRMEVIHFPGYTEEEKVEIARRFLIPRQLKEHGLEGYGLTFTEEALRTIIRRYTYEAGVRNLEREIARICRKVARRLAEGKRAPKRITPARVEAFLGPPRFDDLLRETEDQVGVAHSLAWTPAGGDLMPVEVVLTEGKGSVTLTGQLGEVMQESAQAALTYTRAHAREWEIDPRIFEKVDIHIHLPEGAIPKDGPSAGITLATALISAFSGYPVRHTVAMTGEITLRGKVLPVGGIREKVLAAHRARIPTVILPEENRRDLVEVPERVRRGLRFVFVRSMEEVLREALAPERARPPFTVEEEKEENGGREGNDEG